MFGTPLTPDSIKAETAYRLERTKRTKAEFRSAQRRERAERAGPAARHDRTNAVPDPLLEIRDGVLTSLGLGLRIT